MTATAEPPAAAGEAPVAAPLRRGEGVALLGELHGCGYRDGAALVRRGDGQMVQLGTLMYTLLECADGERDTSALAEAMSERLGRRVEPAHVERLAQKLTAQGLLAGTEERAPPRRNPLLALRWKVLVTDPDVTRRLTAPFTVLFRPWVMWPMLAGFAYVFWFVLIHKGVASATTQAFRDPGLLLLVFAMAVASAGFHELGHAAACRYGGATPGGMGLGLYLVWPAFYTDVTDAYRLPRRARLRVDLGGLYFNAAVAVVTMALWLIWRRDALLLVVALQVLQMVKQLSPIIRADGYHILADATGIPDLYAHMGPTLRRLLPGHRSEPSALTGRARALVTLWVLIVVPILLALSLSAVLLFPKLATSAWDSGRQIATTIPHQAGHGQIIDVLASLVRLLALAVPVLGSALVTQRIVRTVVAKARVWSRSSLPRRATAIVAAAAAIAGLAWAWWPSGQYQPVRSTRGGTLGGLVQLVSDPQTVSRPTALVAPVRIAPGRHLAVVMIPVGGASRRDPALFVIPGAKGKPALALLSYTTPKPRVPASTGSASSSTTTSTTASSSATSSTTTAPASPSATSTTPTSTPPVPAAAFPFRLPGPPGPGGTQALAINRTNGGVLYDVAYSLVTVTNGAPVAETNSAYAVAQCQSCTTVAVSFQLILIVGQSRVITPINAAGALNYNCPACSTTAIADQMVLTLRSVPSSTLTAELEADLRKLDALSALGAGGTPAAVAAAVSAVQQQIAGQLQSSGLLTGAGGTSTAASNTSTTGASSSTATSTTSSTPTGTTTTSSPPTTATTAPQTSPPSTTTGSSTTSPASSSTTTSQSSTTSTTSTAPAASSPAASSSTTTTSGG